MNETNHKKLYIAGMGMITPVGHNVATTVAAIRASKSAYGISEYRDLDDSLITMAQIPQELFDEFEIEVETEQAYSGQMDRIIKMSILAIQEACAQHLSLENLPLVLAIKEPDIIGISQSLLTKNLEIQFPGLISAAYTRACSTGRAGGIDCVKFAFDYLLERFNYVLIGGGDSYRHPNRLLPLKEKSRLMTHKNNDGFVPGEAASYMLLTPDASLAAVYDGSLIALLEPGVAEEEGNILSEKPYKGDGLDRTFKQALINQPNSRISRIYSSMNGENYWAKEYGVAFLRNKQKFAEKCRVEHPADCYGDLGAATATSLLIQAAHDLLKSRNENHALVYASSDGANRGAVVVEKIAVENHHD